MIQRILPLALFATACAGSQPPPEPTPAPAPEPPVAAAEPAPAPSPAPVAATAEPPKPSAPKPILTFKEGLATPESVFYDDAADRYLVSNINGKPTDLDNNGYIAELSPDGKVTKPKFVTGGNDVKLNAPKGMAIHGGILYVADVTTVRKFEAKTGAPKGEIPIPGATFLNDVAATADGRIFVSDSGVKVGAEGFDPTGTDAVWAIDRGKPKALAKSKDLGGPNGLLPISGGILVNTFLGNELYRLDDKGAKQDVTKLPDGSLDGLLQLGDKLLVTSWKAQTIYRGKLNEKFEPVIPNVSAPADIGYDSKRNRVLVPRFLDSTVEVYELE